MTLQINESRYREMTSSPTGTIGRWLGRTAKEIESVAKTIATEERLVRTGRYLASIVGVLTSEADGLVAKVGSAVPHARLLERGTPEHVIIARAPVTRAIGNFPIAGEKKALWWDMPNDRGWMVQPDDGRPVLLVHHPGTRPYQVLHRAMLRVLRGGIA